MEAVALCCSGGAPRMCQAPSQQERPGRLRHEGDSSCSSAEPSLQHVSLTCTIDKPVICRHCAKKSTRFATNPPCGAMPRADLFLCWRHREASRHHYTWLRMRASSTFAGGWLRKTSIPTPGMWWDRVVWCIYCVRYLISQTEIPHFFCIQWVQRSVARSDIF